MVSQDKKRSGTVALTQPKTCGCVMFVTLLSLNPAFCWLSLTAETVAIVPHSHQHWDKHYSQTASRFFSALALKVSNTLKQLCGVWNILHTAATNRDIMKCWLYYFKGTTLKDHLPFWIFYMWTSCWFSDSGRLYIQSWVTEQTADV